MSAHSNNDTLHGGYKLNISTTMSTLPSTTTPVAKYCVLEMNESEISEIVELFNSARVHVVDIHVSFSSSSHDKELSDFHVKLLNPVGREILYSLEKEEFRFVTWTLNAGIRNFKLHVNESQNDCIERQKNVADFAFENMQNIVRRVNLATNYEVWYSFKETSSEKVQEICCQITKHSLPKCNHGCSKGNSFLFASEAPWIVILVMMLFFAWFYLSWLLYVFLFRTEFDLEYPKYYKLEESRMSPSFILFKIIFEDKGRVVSFIRSCALVGVLSYFTYLLFRQYEIINVLMLILSVFWGLSFLISYLYRSKITKSSIFHRNFKVEPLWYIFAAPFIWVLILFVTNGFREIRQGTKSGELAAVIKVLTFPFNRWYWRNIIKTLYTISASFIERVRVKFRNPVLKILALSTCYVLAILISALYVSILFLYLTILAILSPPIYIGGMVSLTHVFEYKFVCCPAFRAVLRFFLFVCLAFFPVFTVGVITSAIQSFLLGLFLNLIYFIPYFAFFSVLTFYCGNYWKTMEEKYLVLKRLIYEACRDIQPVNNGCIPNRHPKREEKVLVLPVVSKELYDKIREELLPYDTNLFYFALKIFWAFAFSFGILKLIEMLNEFNVTGLVQVITTASLGVLPHIFNMIALKTSKKNKKAREEKFNLNVKYMVEDLLREDPELARTVLIIQRSVHGPRYATTDENVQYYEHIQASSDLNSPDNDDMVEFPIVIVRAQENNGTTADENVQDSEHTEASSDLNSPDNDDLEEFPIVIVHAQENNDATTDENVQDYELVEVKCDNGGENGRVKENIQYESSM